MYRFDVFEKSSGSRVAILENVISATDDQEISSAYSIDLKYPADDEKVGFFSPAYELRLYNQVTKCYEGYYKLQTVTEEHDSSGYYLSAQYSNVLIQLVNEDNKSYDSTSTPKSLELILNDILNLQDNLNPFTLGTVEISTELAYNFSELNLLQAITNLQKIVGGYFEPEGLVLHWRADYSPSSYYEDKLIRDEKNLKSISKETDYSSQINRVYAYGSGDGDVQVKLDNVAKLSFVGGVNQPTIGDIIYVSSEIYGSLGRYVIESGSYTSDDAAGYYILYDCVGAFEIGQTLQNDPTDPTEDYGDISEVLKQNDVGYIEDSVSQITYGIQSGQIRNAQITHPATLLLWSERVLEQYKNPIYQYTIDCIDLSEKEGYDYALEHLSIGDGVTVIDKKSNIQVNTYVVSKSSDLINSQNISLQLSTVAEDLSSLIGNIQDNQHLSESIATQIGAGQVIVQGTVTVQDWASEGTTTIDGSKITTNTVSLNTLNFTPLSAGDGLSTGEIIGTINGSEEGVKIQASKIDIVAGNQVYRQDSEPSSPSEGDLWYDLDDDEKLYIYSESGDWVVEESDIYTPIYRSIFDAYRNLDYITMYYNSPGFLPNVGDIVVSDSGWAIYTGGGSYQSRSCSISTIWYVSSHNPIKLYLGVRPVSADDYDLHLAYDGTVTNYVSGSWHTVSLPFLLGDLKSIVQVLNNSLNSNRTDIFYQATEPTANKQFDLWIDTDDNSIYGYTGSAWTELPNEVSSLILDAMPDLFDYTNGIIYYYRSSAPTGAGIGYIYTTSSSQYSYYHIGWFRWLKDEQIDTNTAQISVTQDEIALKVSQSASEKASVVVNAINGGTVKINAANIILDGEVSATDDIRSSDYSAGSLGWIIKGDGDSEFNNITIRGAVLASDGSLEVDGAMSGKSTSYTYLENTSLIGTNITPFTVGESVTGQTSGATGVVHSSIGYYGEDGIYISVTSGTFQVDEIVKQDTTISDPTLGDIYPQFVIDAISTVTPTTWSINGYQSASFPYLNTDFLTYSEASTDGKITVGCGIEILGGIGFSGTITGNVVVSGTLSCGSNSLTCGALSCSGVSSSGAISAPGQWLTCGSVSCGTIGCTAVSATGNIESTGGSLKASSVYLSDNVYLYTEGNRVKAKVGSLDYEIDWTLVS
jgi:hypothetical protein